MPTFGSQLNIMVDPEKRDKVKRKARGQGLTVNELINKLLDQWLLDQWGESQDDESLTPIIEKVIGDRFSLHSRLLQEIQSELMSQRDRLSRLESLALPPIGGDEVQPMENSSPQQDWEDVRPDNIPVQIKTEPIPPDNWLDGNGIRIKLNQDIGFAPKDWKKGNIVLISTFNPFKKIFSRGFAVGDGDYTARASIDQVDEIYVDWSFKLHNKDYPENHPDYPQYLRSLGIPIFNWDREKVLGDFDPDLLADPRLDDLPNPDKTLPDQDSLVTGNGTDDTIFERGLTRTELSQRLKGKDGTIAANLTKWKKNIRALAKNTQAIDPDGIAWGFKGGRYFPYKL